MEYLIKVHTIKLYNACVYEVKINYKYCLMILSFLVTETNCEVIFFCVERIRDSCVHVPWAFPMFLPQGLLIFNRARKKY